MTNHDHAIADQINGGPLEGTMPAAVLVLSADEGRVRDYVRAHHEADIALLKRVVNLSSETQNRAGVRQVGTLFGAELQALGFDVRMSDMRGKPVTRLRSGRR